MGKIAVTVIQSALTLCLLSSISCARRQHLGPVPVPPPDRNYVDLRPQEELRVENAYYKKGASRQGLQGFLGTEIARYKVRSKGLRLISVQSMKNRPVEQLPVQRLISAPKKRYRNYRFFFEIVFKQNSHRQGSVLLGANSQAEIDRLTSQLARPEAVCNDRSTHCTVFPEACSVSIEMNIVVNGKPRTVFWGSVLASVVESPRHLELLRLSAGRLLPVEIDSQDPNALRLPLLPGDHINWE